LSAPDPRKQKASRAVIDRLFADAKNVWVIHYSCESFYDRTDGRSPRITSIAIRKLDAGQTVSFSIHQVAELGGIDLAGITAQYDAFERKMLDAYFAHIGSHRGMKYLHWNMRDINYGFAAIEHRYRMLGGDPFVIPDDNKFDLARLLIDIYGVEYTGHPRLTTILEKNRVEPRDFLNGASEAEAFEQQNYVGLHQSTLRKVMFSPTSRAAPLIARSRQIPHGGKCMAAPFAHSSILQQRTDPSSYLQDWQALPGLRSPSNQVCPAWYGQQLQIACPN